jgi:putative transcriptional regulator
MKKMDLQDNFFKLEYNKIPPQKGSVLISEPYSSDYFFRRSVVLLVEHNDSGSVGFILNKPFGKDLKEIVNYFEDFNSAVNIGGPVGNQNLYYIHTLGDKIKGSVAVKDNLFWGGNFAHVKDLALSGALNENDIKFFVGYSGWDKGQLDSEIKKDYWLVTDTKTEEIMANADNIWKTVLQKLETRYRIWSNFPVNPESN